MSTRRSPSMGKTVPAPKGKNDDYELLQRITKDPHYVARLKGVDAPPPPTSANTAMGVPFTRNGNVGSGGAWAAAPATTRASSNALGLGGGGSSAGMARLWDNHYSQDRIPNYDAVNDRFCKFNLKKRAGSTERKNNTGVVDNNRIPVYSRNGVTSASADIGRGVGAPASGGRLAPLSGRASPVPITQQQNFEGANNEANMGNAYMNTAAISSSGDSIDTLFQKSRHRLLALWEELGTLEADRAPLGPAMTLLPGQAPSVENIRTITNEIQRLVDLRNAAVEVEKAIELREGFLYLLQELAERFAAMASSTPTERDKAYRELVALVTPFRNASLQTVEAIGRWRK